MENCNDTVNAGVHASTGFEFQKHCALYFLFNKYQDLKTRRYFICFEHHDDVLFCYQNSDELISSINAYQAKKSSTQWALGADMYDIIKKMTEVGLSLHADSIPKTEDYKHTLEFITNNSIKLIAGSKKDNSRKSQLINESNNKVNFIDLDKEISKKIKREITKLLIGNLRELDELDNLSMGFIDLPKTNQQQKDCLVGQFASVFGNNVRDPKAAVDTLLLLFRDVENTLNQGNSAKLLDKSKRVDCDSINNTINIITTKSMAYELWRDEKKEICNKLHIPISQQSNFILEFDNSFDRFKDLQQVEHLKILTFVKQSSKFETYTDEIDCIQVLYNEFRKKKVSQLSEQSIKAAIYAAYIEVRETL